ncbi:hypothetical protein SVAN01_01468 [Stagonosporopsis vannaccii]|nr:hypothetical protein SVAN01_01468 [Stagonosporopsis vannaccii]
MTYMFGLLSTVAKTIPSVNGAGDIEGDVYQPLLAKNESMRDASEIEDSSRVHQRPTNLEQSTRKPDSHLEVQKSAETSVSTNDFVQASLHSKSPTSPGARLQTPRPNTLRSITSSVIETQSHSSVTDIADSPIQREIIVRLSNIKELDASRRNEEQRNSSVNARTRKAGCGENSEWRSLTHSISDPYLSMTSTASKRSNTKPLKTCLKQKSKSADTTPTNKTLASCDQSPEKQKLRRRKTVDFAETVLESGFTRVDVPDRASTRQEPKAEKDQKQKRSCPGTAMLSMPSMASPAITRTDVHVIAITPSSSNFVGAGQTQPKNAKGDPATPTMQIVESRNGSYEIIWDDVPPEHNVRTQRRSSAAGEALGALSTSSRGLERVNTKLTEWSGTWNTPSQYFKPTIVVFPDDDGSGPRSECTVIDYDDIGIFAPPNSESASAVHSCHGSRPASACMSSMPSQDGPRSVYFIQDTNSSPEQLSPVTPDPRAWPAHRLATHRKLEVLSPDRKLSNIEEADVRFRDHRDSVTLAHSRLIKSGAMTPELFAHRDSVTLAKRRMYAKNHTISTS